MPKLVKPKRRKAKKAMVPTPHIGAKRGEIAPLVLLSGDPNRAKWIAETFLENVRCVTTVRGLLGYTGTWNGVKITVMTSGMGQPSLGIIVNELIQFYGVKKIIRVGSAGSLQAHIKKMAIVIGTGASTDSGMNNARFPFTHFAPIANPALARAAENVSESLGIKVYTGGVLASDFFYPYMDPKTLEFYWGSWKVFARYGVLAVEMESAELFTLAALHGVQALTLLTISDTLARKSKPLTSLQRANSFKPMIMIALRTLVA